MLTGEVRSKIDRIWNDYQSPFVDVAPVGPSALFTESDVHRLFETAAAVRTTAEVA